MNKQVRIILILTSITLSLFAKPDSFYAQEDGAWWKNIFRAKCDTTQVIVSEIDTIQVIRSDSSTTNMVHLENQLDSVLLLPQELPVLEKRLGLGSVQLYMDSSILDINKSYIYDVKPLKGYRIQIHFGDLQSARNVRAKCRRRIPNQKVYLESIAPNYIVSVGNFRDRWDAEFALESLKKLYPIAVIVPTDIELPKL